MAALEKIIWTMLFRSCGNLFIGNSTVIRYVEQVHNAGHEVIEARKSEVDYELSSSLAIAMKFLDDSACRIFKKLRVNFILIFPSSSGSECCIRDLLVWSGYLYHLCIMNIIVYMIIREKTIS